MPTITISGWRSRREQNGVALIQVLREEFALGLAQAHGLVSEMLTRPIELEAKDASVARVLERIESCGAVAKISD